MLIHDANIRDAPAFKRCFFEARCETDFCAKKHRQQARETEPDSRLQL
jgi:hypothetical protein